jgi:dTDP-4-amino-4,6-dideoxygalactose transaminase
MRRETIPFALPSIGEEEIAEVVDTLRSGWLTTGPKTRQFEKEFAEFIGVPFAIAVNSGTAALHLSLEAIGLGEGDFVVTTPFTFAASAEVIRYFGAHPLFADIDPATMNIAPGKIAEATAKALFEGKRVKAILPVHFGGLACDMDAIVKIAAGNGLKVVSDAAHAFPTVCRGAWIGSVEDLAAFSFYATKPLATGEGGMVTTSNEGYAERIRTMRLHGINRDIWDRYKTVKPNWYYEIMSPGFKYNLTDVASSIGIHQLRKAKAYLERRREIAGIYTEAFGNLPLLLPSDGAGESVPSWHLYVIRLCLDRLDIGRDRFIEMMSERGIGTSVHFIPLHLHPYWRDKYGFRPEDFPEALAAYWRCVSLPIYTRMTDGDVSRVVEAVTDILTKYSR